jgi:hypothetical protein
LLLSGEEKNMISIDAIWRRVVSCQGETFLQKRGGRFKYEIVGSVLHLDRTDQTISKGHLEKTLEFLPFESTAVIRQFRAPSYIYAILMDERIRQGDW